MVVRGEPTPEELAALVAVLAARAAQAAPAGVTPGLGAWRLSARRPGVRTRASW